MEAKESHIYFKTCVEHNITIYPKPSNLGKYKIIINTNGKEKIGDEIYENTSVIREKILHTPSGIKKEKIIVPSVWDKINELYQTICEKNKFLTINNQ